MNLINKAHQVFNFAIIDDEYENSPFRKMTRSSEIFREKQRRRGEPGKKYKVKKDKNIIIEKPAKE